MTVAAVVFAVAAASLALGLGLKPTVLPARDTADAPSAGSAASGPAEAVKYTARFPPAISSPSAFPRHHAAKRRHHAAVTATPSSSASPSVAVTPSATPSGAASTGDGSSWPASVPGWQLTYSTDFPGNSLPSGWDAYNGEPGGDPDGNWVSSNVTVSGGALHLAATPSAQGGVAFYGNPQTYGMYLVRMKGDDEPDLDINNLAILWPAQQGVWPPEVDFFQDLGGTRQNFSASLHPGPNGNGGCCVIGSPNQDSNGTAWHTYGVQWTPSTMTYTIDGRVWASVSSSSLSSGTQWPDIPMNLTLQSQNQASAQPSGTTDTMTVAWVAEYSMSS
jgi:beta-glucanase (GH16 family)